MRHNLAPFVKRAGGGSAAGGVTKAGERAQGRGRAALAVAGTARYMLRGIRSLPPRSRL